MPALFTPKLRTIISSMFNDSITNFQTDIWIPSTHYTEGDQVYWETNKYVCKITGTSGSNPPIHVSGTFSDGSTSWIWVDFVSTNQSFRRNMYIVIGKDTSWNDENTPDSINIGDIGDFQTFQNFLTLKQITNSNCKSGIQNIPWVSGNVYSQYDDSKDPFALTGPSAYTHPFYVVTNDNNVYKCINNNNGGQSTSKPSDTGTVSFLQIDGYVWKFMGTLENDLIDFLTSDFFPVKYISTNDNSLQWNVQQNATKQSLSTFNILKSVGTFTNITSTLIGGGIPSTPAQIFITKNNDNTLKQILVDPNNVGVGYDLRIPVISIIQNSSAEGSGGAVRNNYFRWKWYNHKYFCRKFRLRVYKWGNSYSY